MNVPSIAASDQTPLRIRSAVPGDLDTLCRLEQSTFDSDRISRRSWRHLITGQSSHVLIADAGTIAGAAVILRRSGQSVARLYSIGVARHSRRRGVARLLLQAALDQAAADGLAIFRLETRIDNLAAQRLFARFGFHERDRRPAYYADGTDAIRYQRALPPGGAMIPIPPPIPPAVLPPVPPCGPPAAAAAYYGQTLDFTCGACALLMAMAALDPDIVLDRTAEIRVWREATTVFMAAGHGGCGPYGLAGAAIRRGFGATIYAPAGDQLFVGSVRDDDKKAVIALVESDFRAQLAQTPAVLDDSAVTPERIAEHLRSGGIPIVLISLWRLHAQKGPHWVVVTGCDTAGFRILDPMIAPAGDDHSLTIGIDEFRRITRYGRRRQTAAIVISRERRV